MDITNETKRLKIQRVVSDNGVIIDNTFYEYVAALKKQYKEEDFRFLVRIREYLQEEIIGGNEPAKFQLLELFYHKKENEKDWRTIRKLLLLLKEKTFERENFELWILDGFKKNVSRALDILLWKDDSREDYKEAIEILTKLRDISHDALRNQETKVILIESIVNGEFSKSNYNFNFPLFVGDDGGLYASLKGFSETCKKILIAGHEITEEFLKEIGVSDKNKLILGEGMFGEVFFALSLFDNGLTAPGELICVKKIKSSPDLPITEAVFNDFNGGRECADLINSPRILDLGFITDVYRTKIIKGFVMMEAFPKINGKKIFEKHSPYLKWEYQKPYLLDIIKTINTLLNRLVLYTDLKPSNVLFDPNTCKAKLIDLGSIIKLESHQEIINFDASKINFQNKLYSAPEVKREQSNINIRKSLVYTCAKMIEQTILHGIKDQTGDEINTKVAQLIKPCLDINYNNRPGSLTYIIDGLENIDTKTKRNMKKIYIEKVKKILERKPSVLFLKDDINTIRKYFVRVDCCQEEPNRFSNKSLHNVYDILNKFFQEENIEKHIMVVLGSGGSGKSTILQLKFIQAVEDWDESKRLPLFLDFSGGYDFEKLMSELNDRLGTKLDFLNIPVDLFLNGVETMFLEFQSLERLERVLSKLEPKSKILISSRNDTLESKAMLEKIYIKFQTIFLSPLNYSANINHREEAKRWLDSNSENLREIDLYREIIYKSSDSIFNDEYFKSLIDTGLVFDIMMKSLVKLNFYYRNLGSNFSKQLIYDNYTKDYIENKISSLSEKKIDALLSYFDEPCFENSEINKLEKLMKNLITLATELALEIYYSGRSTINSENSNYFGKVLFLNHKTVADEKIIRVLECLPIKIEFLEIKREQLINESKVLCFELRFINDSLKNTFLINAIFQEIHDRKRENLILEKRQFQKDFSLTQQLAGILQPYIYKAILIGMVTQSKFRNNEESVILASSAMSILVAAKHNLSNLDLSGIKICGANLNNALLENTNLAFADLRYVNLRHAILSNTKLYKTKMDHLDHGISVIFRANRCSFLSLSEDWRYIVTWDKGSGAILLFERCSKGGLTIAKHNNIMSLKISPNNKAVLWTTQEGLFNFDFETKEIFRVFKGVVKFFEISEQSTYAAICCSEKNIILVSLKKREVHFNFTSNKPSLLALSPDENFLVCDHPNNIINVFNIKNKSLEYSLLGDKVKVTCFLFSKNKNILYCGCMNGYIYKWDILTASLISKLLGHNNPVKYLAISHNENIMSSACDHKISILDCEIDSIIDHHFHNKPNITLAFSDDDRKLAIYSRNYVNEQSIAVEVWDLENNFTIQNLQGHTHPIRSIVVTKDSKFIYSVSSDNCIHKWKAYLNGSIASKKTLPNIEKNSINIFQLSSQGTYLSISIANTILLYQCSDLINSFKFELKANLNICEKLLFSQDERMLAVVYRDLFYEFKESFEYHILIFEIDNGGGVLKQKIDDIFNLNINSLKFDNYGKIVFYNHVFKPFGYKDENNNETTCVCECCVFICPCLLKNICARIPGQIVTINDEALHIIPVSSSKMREICKKIAVISPSKNLIIFGNTLKGLIELNNILLGISIPITIGRKTLNEQSIIDFTPNEKFILLTSFEKIFVLNSDGSLNQCLMSHQACINFLSFSADSSHFISCSIDMTFILWSIDLRHGSVFLNFVVSQVPFINFLDGYFFSESHINVEGWQEGFKSGSKSTEIKSKSELNLSNEAESLVIPLLCEHNIKLGKNMNIGQWSFGYKFYLTIFQVIFLIPLSLLLFALLYQSILILNIPTIIRFILSADILKSKLNYLFLFIPPFAIVFQIIAFLFLFIGFLCISTLFSLFRSTVDTFHFLIIIFEKTNKNELLYSDLFKFFENSIEEVRLMTQLYIYDKSIINAKIIIFNIKDIFNNLKKFLGIGVLILILFPLVVILGMRSFIILEYKLFGGYFSFICRGPTKLDQVFRIFVLPLLFFDVLNNIILIPSNYSTTTVYPFLKVCSKHGFYTGLQYCYKASFLIAEFWELHYFNMYEHKRIIFLNNLNLLNIAHNLLENKFYRNVY